MNRTRNAGKLSGGFTLLELLVVIAIIGILAGLILPVLSSVICTSKEATAAEMISNIETAMKSYEEDFGILPPDMPGGESTDYVEAMKKASNRGTAYYNFKENQMSNGRLYSPLGNGPDHEIKFQRSGKMEEDGLSNNSSRDPENEYKPDLWTQNCEGVVNGVNNWQ